MVDLKKAIPTFSVAIKSSPHKTATMPVELHSACSPFRREVAWVNDAGPSLTRQEFADECDINKLLEGYDKNGVSWPGPAPGVEPMYLDCTEWSGDYREHMDHLIKAEEAFMSLPANVRKEFANDSVAFVEFAMKKDNLPKLQEWGLAPPPPAPAAVMRVEVVNAPAAGSAAPTASQAGSHSSPT